MSVYTFARSRAIPAPEAPDSIETVDAKWGLTIREAEMPEAEMPTGEKIMKVTGAIALVSATLLWMTPGLWIEMQAPVMHMTLSGALASLGLVLFGANDETERGEVQFDTLRREVRFAIRKGQGKARTAATVAMDHVVGVTVEPIVPGSEYAEMRLVIDGLDGGLLVVSGRRTDLEPTAQRLRRDLRRPSQRLESQLGAELV